MIVRLPFAANIDACRACREPASPAPSAQPPRPGLPRPPHPPRERAWLARQTCAARPFPSFPPAIPKRTKRTGIILGKKCHRRLLLSWFSVKGHPPPAAPNHSGPGTMIGSSSCGNASMPSGRRDRLEIRHAFRQEYRRAARRCGCPSVPCPAPRTSHVRRRRTATGQDRSRSSSGARVHRTWGASGSGRRS